MNKLSFKIVIKGETVVDSTTYFDYYASKRDVKREPKHTRVAAVIGRDGKVIVDNSKKVAKPKDKPKKEKPVEKEKGRVAVVVEPKTTTTVDLRKNKKEEVELPDWTKIYDRPEEPKERNEDEINIIQEYVDITPFENNNPTELKIFDTLPEKGPECTPEIPKRKRKRNDKYVSVKDLKEKKNHGGDITKLPKDVQDIITNPEPEEIPFPVPPGVNTNADLNFYSSYMDNIEDDEYSEYDNEPTFEKMKSNKKGGME